MLFGEAPGEDEDLNRRPFVGKAGRLLNFLLAKGRMNRENLTIANTIFCRPPNNRTPTQLEIQHCEQHRDAAVKAAAPRILVALGNTALQTLTNGVCPTISSARGYAFKSVYRGLPVVATWHPSFFLHNRSDAIREQKGKAGLGGMHSLIFDICQKIHIPLEDPRPKLVHEPSQTELVDLISPFPPDYLAVDIETPMSTENTEEDLHGTEISQKVIRVSLGTSSLATSFPWTPPYRDALNHLLPRFNRLVFWNYRFDVPRLRAAGVRIPKAKIIDAMWLFHFMYPHLPYGLGNAATYYTGLPEWKSLARAESVYYSAMDALATAEIYEGLLKELPPITDRHVTKLLHILDKMSERGVLIDQTELADFRSTLEAEVAPLKMALQRAEPRALRRYSPPEGYKSIPRDRTLERGCETCKSVGKVEKIYKNGKRRLINCKVCKGKGYHRELDVTGLEKMENGRWGKLLPFNAGSSKQLLAYMNYHDHRLSKRGRQPTSSDDRTLARLASRYPEDPVYPLVQEIRGLDKLLTTYASWPVAADGRVHTEFTLKPETQRLSSVRPNVQNIPQPDDDDPNSMRLRFRRCLVASPGHTLLSIDYSGIEAVLTGWFAGDTDYMLLAKKGIHAYITACYLEEDVTPETFTPADKKRIAHDYPKLYKQIKSGVHGINYGEGAKKLYELNQSVYKSPAEARTMWEFIRSMIPKVIEWQERTIDRAFRENQLVNPFGYRSWFWDKDVERNEALAYLPQSTAAAIIKEAMLRIDPTPSGEYLVFQIHDELVSDVPNNLLDAVSQTHRTIMERPIPELDNLVIGTSGKIGPNLGDMETIW